MAKKEKPPKQEDTTVAGALFMLLISVGIVLIAAALAYAWNSQGPTGAKTQAKLSSEGSSKTPSSEAPAGKDKKDYTKEEMMAEMHREKEELEKQAEKLKKMEKEGLVDGYAAPKEKKKRMKFETQEEKQAMKLTYSIAWSLQLQKLVEMSEDLKFRPTKTEIKPGTPDFVYNALRALDLQLADLPAGDEHEAAALIDQQVDRIEKEIVDQKLVDVDPQGAENFLNVITMIRQGVQEQRDHKKLDYDPDLDNEETGGEFPKSDCEEDWHAFLTSLRSRALALGQEDAWTSDSHFIAFAKNWIRYYGEQHCKSGQVADVVSKITSLVGKHIQAADGDTQVFKTFIVNSDKRLPAGDYDPSEFAS